MTSSNLIQEKSYQFALSVVEFCRILAEEKREYIMSKQLLKSGTSIGANVEEAIHAPSKKDFVNKLSISLKEAHESWYWIRLIKDSGYAESKKGEIQKLSNDISEIIALLTSIIKTARLSLDES